jgi:hypothetical protein
VSNAYLRVLVHHQHFNFAKYVHQKRLLSVSVVLHDPLDDAVAALGNISSFLVLGPG